MSDLVTLREWKELPPKAQGYAWYMQAELRGSELKGQKNPYELGTKAYMAYEDGVFRATLEAQDSEE